FVLHTYADKERGMCWPSRQLIAAGASCDKRTVDQAVRRLEHHGFLAVSRTRGRTSNNYWLRIPSAAPAWPGGALDTEAEVRGYGEPDAPATANLTSANGGAGSPEVGSSKGPVNQPREAATAAEASGNENDSDEEEARNLP